MPPADLVPEYGDKGVDPHILRPIAKAWSWRRKLDSGQAAKIQDIATAEDVTPVHVGRALKLAYLASTALERLLTERRVPAVSLKDIVSVAELAWAEQAVVVFEAAALNCAPGQSIVESRSSAKSVHHSERERGIAKGGK